MCAMSRNVRDAKESNTSRAVTSTITPRDRNLPTLWTNASRRCNRSASVTFQPVAANLVSSVRLRNLATGAVWQQEVEGFFVAIGHIPNTAVFKGQIETDADGYIISKGGARTNIPGVFHAGDVQDRTYRQAITASGAGCMAAMEAERFLEAEGH